MPNEPEFTLPKANHLSPRNRLLHLPAGFLLLLAVLLAVGCTERTSSKLLGKWVGRPDTAEARATRETEKYSPPSDSSSGALEEFNEPTSSGKSLSVKRPRTDWERFDAEVVLNFVSRDRIEMSLGDGSQPRTATWRIISTSPVGLTIEVETPAGTDAANGIDNPAVVRRRFEIEVDERDGEYRGFLLRESGADLQLGALYFERPGEP